MEKIHEELIVAGIGGQGIQLMCKILFCAADSQSLNSIYSPDYSPETRGGPSYGFVIISDKTIGNPVVCEPTTLIAMHNRGLEKYLDSVVPEGLILFNSDLALNTNSMQRNDIEIAPVPALSIAKELGNNLVANVVMLGAYTRARNLVSIKSIEETIKQELKEKQKLIDVNIQALHKGYEFCFEYEGK
ncbi:2-oxoacid:acceptor oxidoreductase family protein [Candidatus Pacearchaeota archaeon]|nr:2-oxoacid:acceptor oxidoreductase family protein [Candidatus Pacearchaeota archaeon]